MESQTDPKPLPWFFAGEAVALERTDLFKNNKLNVLTNALGKPDTQSIWYSREHIAKLLEEIDHAGGDGLRIYFGMYEASHPNFSGQLCLMMSATRAVQQGENIIHQKVILENEPDFINRSSLPRDISFTGERGFNFGSPCPPICD